VLGVLPISPLEEFGNGFHMIMIEVVLADMIGVMPGIGGDLDDESLDAFV
jgi:hypothetical protein